MIYLDTNYLIRALVPQSLESKKISQWLSEGHLFTTSTISWYEFLCGPVTEKEITLIQALLGSRISSFNENHASAASRLFNQIGRPRKLRIDTMIAAVALVEGYQLATSNLRDFERFHPYGLKLLPAT